MGEPARMLDEDAVRRALSEELAPKRVDVVLERVRQLAGDAPASRVRRVTDAEIDAKLRRSMRRKGVG